MARQGNGLLFFVRFTQFFLYKLTLSFHCPWLRLQGANLGGRLKEAGKNAGAFVGEVAKDAKGNATEIAGRVGSAVKSRWVLLQQPSVRHAVQERLIETAASTGSFLRKGISGTKDKVVVGKTKVEEVGCVETWVYLMILVYSSCQHLLLSSSRSPFIVRYDKRASLTGSHTKQE